jgi:hypothetical protein
MGRIQRGWRGDRPRYPDRWVLVPVVTVVAVFNTA